MNNRLSILLVEDSEDDVFLMERAVRTAALDLDLTVRTDGQAAIDFLAEAKGTAWPDLVLLDLQLPHQTGFDVLTWIRGQTPSRSLVVIMLTSSAQPRDIDQAYGLGANGYLVKPSSPAELRLLLTDLQQFWGKWNRFPAKP